MSGNKFLLDTNAIIQLLKGNEEVKCLIENAELVCCSVLSELEFSSFPNLSTHDLDLLKNFISKVFVIDLCSFDEKLKKSIVEIRQERKVKLPDAIIIASAIRHGCSLVTADKKLLTLTQKCHMISFESI